MVIKIRKIGKMFEIKRIYKENVVTRYAKANNVENRVNMLCKGVLYV